MQRYDTIVAGVGGMGSAALYHLAKRGRSVLGLERFDIPNDMGSSHGVTRIIRLAYYEHPNYVPLLKRAYTLWQELEDVSWEQLLYVTGSIDAGPLGSGLFEDSLASCELHGLPHEVLDGRELRQRFPGYSLPLDMPALLQPEGGFLLPERCIVQHVLAAIDYGADVHGREGVLNWEPRGERVVVRTERGDYAADHLVITAGSWAGKLAPNLTPLAIPERQVVAWFQPTKPALFEPERFPVFNCIVEEGRYYGFPVFGVPGFKVGRYHHLEQEVDPDTLDRECTREDEEVLRTFAARYFPDAAGPTMAMKVCMFTNSPDEHFILDTLPDCPQVTVAAGFSGHGFKFCSVIGEILADMVMGEEMKVDIEFLRLGRFDI